MGSRYFALLWFVAGPAFAVDVAWHESQEIQYLYAGQSGNRFALKTNEDSGCSYANEYIVLQANPFFKEMVSLLIAANMAGKRIAFYTNGDCLAGGAVVTDIRVPK